MPHAPYQMYMGRGMMKYIIVPKHGGKAMEKPKDWAFMEQSGKVLRDLPSTWKQYANDTEGAMGIIKMEYKEMLNADTDEAKMHELVHLASACLNLWRKLAHAE